MDGLDGQKGEKGDPGDMRNGSWFAEDSTTSAPTPKAKTSPLFPGARLPNDMPSGDSAGRGSDKEPPSYSNSFGRGSGGSGNNDFPSGGSGGPGDGGGGGNGGNGRGNGGGQGPPSGGDGGGNGGGPPDGDPLNSFRDRNPDILNGVNWYEYRMDPRELPRAIIGGDLHTIKPWRAPRRETGSIINYGLPVKIFVVSKDEFITVVQGNWSRLDSFDGSLKEFKYNFPRLPDNASKADILDWLGSIAQYAGGWGAFLPPPHTMRPDTPLGDWGENFARKPHEEALLLQAITQKSTNLLSQHGLGYLASERDVMTLIRKVAIHAGHPSLSLDVQNLSPPRHKNDDSITQYRDSWKHFLHQNYLCGVILSDRYVLESFAKNLNPFYGTNLRPYLMQRIYQVELNRPIPSCFHMDKILEVLQKMSIHVGLEPISLSDTTREIYERQKKSDSKSSTLRKMTTDHAQPMTLRMITIAQIEELSLEDDEDIQLIAQVSANQYRSGRSCDLCGNDSHLVALCPKLKEIKGDRFKLRCVLGLLQGMYPNRSNMSNSRPASSSSATTPRYSSANSGSGSRASTPTSTNTSRNIRQIREDDNSVESILQTTQDDHSLASDGESVKE